MFDEIPNCFAGELLYASEPDWTAVAEMMMTLRAARWTLLADRSFVHADGTWRVPVVFSYSVYGASISGNGAKATGAEARATRYACALESFFKCPATVTAVRPNVEDTEQLRRIQRLLAAISASKSQEEPIEAKLLAPEGGAQSEGAASAKRSRRLTAAKKDPLAKLDSLIGLEPMKAQVREIVSFVRDRSREELPCLHMVFRGNPGTGKTTVARILAEVFDKHGVNKRPGTFVETDRSGLVGQYIGHTAVKTSNILKEADGGVLYYNADELVAVFQQMAKGKGYTASPKAVTVLRGYFRGAVASGGRNFANARIARKALERATLKQAKRSTGRRLSAADIEAALADADLAALARREPARQVGFQAAPAAATIPGQMGPATR